MSDNSTFNHIAIVSLGLIGGSLAKTIKLHLPDQKILGISGNSKSLTQAKEDGAIDEFAGYDDPLPESVDLVIICSPIDKTIPMIQRYVSQRSAQSPHLVITDVASVKESICQPLKNTLPKHVSFVGGHPMAGIEKTGYDHSSADIMTGATYILTTDQVGSDVSKETQSRDALHALLKTCEFNVLECDANSHDKYVALASHLPYLMAILTTENAKAQLSSDQELPFKQIISSGFRDTTRVASSAPEWGSDVCTQNNANLIESIQLLKDQLSQLEAKLKTNDPEALTGYFESIKSFRELLYR